MKKKSVLVLTLYCLLSMTVSAQKIEAFFSVNHNKFFNYPEEEAHYQSEFKSGKGYSVGCQWDGFLLDSHRMTVGIKLENYKGKIEESDGGLGGGYSGKIDINKSVLAISFYPITVQKIKNVTINFGLQFGFYLSDQSKGEHTNWPHNKPFFFEDPNIHENTPWAWGLSACVSYDIPLKHPYSLKPHYFYYLGINKEFSPYFSTISTMRHNLGIGIVKEL